MAGKGNPKTGGRKKGVPNVDKADLLQAIRDTIGDQTYHPVIQMALVATDDDVVERYVKVKNGEHIKVEEPKYSDELRLSAAREVAQYVSPKLKSIEHTADADGLGLNLHMSIGPAPKKKGNGSGG